MEVLGTVEGITADGHALVKCEKVPDIGTAVYDRPKHRIGTVKRILGPVDAPYASVTGEGVAPALKGKKLFITGGRDGQTRKRNNR